MSKQNKHYGGTTVTTALSAAAVTLLGISQPACADVKIVSEITVSGINASGGGPGPNGGPNGGGANQNQRNPNGGGNFGGGQGRGGGRPGGPGGPLLNGLKNGTQTVTTYFKGSKARRETPSGAVVIYDRSADKIYTLDTKAKTYYVASFAETVDKGAKLPDQVQQFMTQTATFQLKTPTTDVASVPVSGLSTQSYTIAGSLSMQPKGGMNGGGPGGQGGFPGGGGQGGQGGPPPNGGQGFNGQNGGMRGGGGGGQGRRGGGGTSLSGDLWVGRSADVFTSASGVQNAREFSLVLAEQVLPSGNPLFKPFVERLTSKNQIPLKSRLVIAQNGPGQPPPPPGGGGDQNGDPNGGPPPPDGGDPNGGPPPGGGGGPDGGQGQRRQPPAPVTIAMEVKSISTDATLSDEYFAVPADYKRVDPPAPPAFGPPGGGGGRGGFPGGGPGGRGGFPGGPPPGGGDPNGGPPPFPGGGEEAPPPPLPNAPEPPTE